MQTLRRVRRTVQLLPAQSRFRHSSALYRGFVGGRGAGKSFVGAYDLLRRIQPGGTYLVGSPTGVLLQDTTFPTFQYLLKLLGIRARIRLAPYPNLYLLGSVVRFRTAEEPDRMRGPNLSGVWLDEASLIDEAAYKITIAALREHGRQGWLSCTFTPKGLKNWTYKVFGKSAPNTAIFHATTRENYFNPPDFAATLAQQYTTSYGRQELGGEFIEEEGSMIKLAWMKFVQEGPAVASRVRYWDKAGTDDGGAFTVGVLMARDGAGRYFVEDVQRAQLSAFGREDLILNTAQRDAARYPGGVTIIAEQEPGSGGKDSAAITVRNLAGFDIHVDKVTGSKEARGRPFAAQVEAGNVLVLERDWTDVYTDEITRFPSSEYADQFDASSGAFNWLTLKRSNDCDVVSTGDEGSILDQLPASIW